MTFITRYPLHWIFSLIFCSFPPRTIERHGGVYSGVLDMEETAVLIIAAPEGDKYEYARKWNIPCLTPDWVFESIDKGYSLPTSRFRVDAAKASSPIKQDETVRLAEVSMCSTILDPNGGADVTRTRKVCSMFIRMRTYRNYYSISIYMRRLVSSSWTQLATLKLLSSTAPI